MPTENKPSKNEDEYFLKLDAERIKEMRASLDAEREKQERKSHFMKCPKDGADLKETDYHHVKVDVCPECHGIWLDSGEIDMLRHVQDHGAGSFVSNLFKGLARRK